MSKRLIIGLSVLVLAAVLAVWLGASGLSWPDWQGMALSGENTPWLWLFILVAAAIDSLNPCAFSVLLLTVGFLFSLGKSRREILRLGLLYILGIFLVYLLIGLGLLRVLALFGIPRFMSKLAASLLLLAGGLSLVNHFFPEFPLKLKIPQGTHRGLATLMNRASAPAVLLLGGLVGLSEFPCTGGPYLVVLGLLHDRATFLPGLGYLALYNLIFILPLAIILVLASAPGSLEKLQAWRRAESGAARLWGGLAMVILGLLILWL